MNKNALIIFTRNPELGKCKTRLAKTIGDEAALNIYKYLLQHTAHVVKQVHTDRFVFYSEEIIENDIWESHHFNKYLQKGSDLGERMYHAFYYLFQMNYSKVIIIGSDLLDLNKDHICNAYLKLDAHDFVFGPASDGGYYLLGMKEMNEDLFRNKLWGTESVLEDSLHDLRNSKVAFIQELNDIDTFEDLEPYDELKQFYI